MFGGWNRFNSLSHQIFSIRKIFKKRMKRIRILGGMDALNKWMIIRFTPYQTTTLPKWMFSQKLLFKSSFLLNSQCRIQVRPPLNSDDLWLLFCLNPSPMLYTFDIFRIQGPGFFCCLAKSDNHGETTLVKKQQTNKRYALYSLYQCTIPLYCTSVLNY